MIIDSPIISGSSAASGSLNQFGNVTITGSLTVTGAIIGAVTGSVDSASYASNAELLDGRDSTTFTSTSSFQNYTSSNDAQVLQLNNVSASFNSYTSSNNANIAALNAATASLYNATSSIYLATASIYLATASIYGATSSLFAYTASNSANVANLFATSASLNAAVADIRNATASLYNATASIYGATSSLFNYSASSNLRIGSLEQYTASLNTRSASFACVTATNNFACTQYFSNTSNAVSFTSTGSLYSDGGVRFTKDMYVSGTAFFNNVTVFGTQSVNYISSSQLNIGTNIISVNTDTPSIRFGGLSVYDSGSTGLTGSMLWDSEDNQWIYSNPSGSTYDSAVFLVGPRNVGVLGNETGISCNFLSKGNGMHHMTSSGIFEDGSRTCFYGSGFITSAGVSCFTTSCASAFVGGTISGTTGNFSGILTVAANSSANAIAINGRSSDNTGTIDFFQNNGTTRVMEIGVSPTAAEFYYDSNSPMIFYTNQCERLRITGCGNVGIGISSPCSVLHISSANSTLPTSGTTPSGIAINYGSNECSNAGIWFSTDIGANQGIAGIAGIRTCQFQTELRFYTNSTESARAFSERMRIAACGLVSFSCQISAPSLVIRNSSVPAIQVFRDLDVVSVGSAGQNIEFGARSGSTFIAGALIGGGLDNPATTGTLVFQTLSGSSLCTRFTILNTGAACFACELTAKTLGTNDLILNNLNYECANYVDGTRGSWLIQEGACDLFIINQVSCKKYKFNLIEIN
jgi:hypothetical protein